MESPVLFSNFPKLLVLVLLFMIILHTPTAKSQPPDGSYYTGCGTKENITASSIYRINLDLLLSSLCSAGSDSGYSNYTTGQNPNQVYGQALCRADVPLDKCRKCLHIARKDILAGCPLVKEAQIWRHYCFLRYSNLNFFGVDETFYAYLASGTKFTDPSRLNTFLGGLIGSLIAKAANSSSLMFAAETTNYDNSIPIYGLVQCTMDLSKDGCSRCLGSLFKDIPVCCGGYDEAKLYGRHCILRYELNPFYSITAVQALSSLPPPTAPPPHAVNPPPATPLPFKNDSSAIPARTDGTRKTIAIIVITVVAALALTFATLLFICIRRRKAVRANRHREEKEELHDRQSVLNTGTDEANILWKSENNGSEFSLYKFSEIADATDHFSPENKLGEGGFGPVFKGKLPNGLEIAAKRLSTYSGQGLVEFKNEIQVIAKLQHRNLVSLIGCCIEGEEKILIYEYMANKSLDFFLFEQTRGALLNWSTRFHIIEGIAQGLLYLHKHSRLRIIHRDLKVSNILLDGDMNAKISDFGMARIFGSNEIQANTNRIVGTYGYMSPEYAFEGAFSIKSDVFSFGVLLLEIVSGKRNAGFHQHECSLNLLGYTWELWKEGKWFEIIDPSLGDGCCRDEMMRCIHAALMCVQENPTDRPTMSNVIAMLSSENSRFPIPKQPAFFNLRIATEAEEIQDIGGTSSTTNNRTITIPYGR